MQHQFSNKKDNSITKNITRKCATIETTINSETLKQYNSAIPKVQG